MHQPNELTFLATPGKGEVSALLTQPEDSRLLLVLGHGASSNADAAVDRRGGGGGEYYDVSV